MGVAYKTPLTKYTVSKGRGSWEMATLLDGRGLLEEGIDRKRSALARGETKRRLLIYCFPED